MFGSVHAFVTGWGLTEQGQRTVQGKCLAWLRAKPLLVVCCKTEKNKNKKINTKKNSDAFVKVPLVFERKEVLGNQTHPWACELLLHTHLLNQCSNKSAGICHSQNGTPLNTHRHGIHLHTQSSEPSHRARWQGEALGSEQESKRRRGSWPALKARCISGGSVAQVWMWPGETLEGFPEHVSSEDSNVAGMVSGQLLGCGQPLFVTEKCDPRHRCPVLSRTLLSMGPELQ